MTIVRGIQTSGGVAIVAPAASCAVGFLTITANTSIACVHAAAWRSNAAGLIWPSVECRRFWL